MPPRSFYVLVGGALALTAFGLFVLVPAITQSFEGHYALGFSDDYDLIGANLAQGRGYRLYADLGETMMREPLYPLFLAGLFWLLGQGIEAARLGNLLLVGGGAVALWHLAQRVTGDRSASLVAVAIFMLHPGMLAAQARGGVEVLFMLAALIFLLLLYRAIEEDRAAWYLAAGLALGALVQVRSTPVVFPLVLGAYLWLSAAPGARLRRLGHCGLLTGAMLLAMTPWVLRNHAVSGAFVPTATVQGVAIQEGLHTCGRTSFGRNFQAMQREAAEVRRQLATGTGWPFRDRFFQYFHSPAHEAAFSRALLDDAIARYRESPSLLARCSAANLLNFWFLGKNGLATAINVAIQLPLLLAAAAGLWLLRRRLTHEAWAPALLFAATLVAVHLPVLAHARHGVPLLPLVALFAAPALVAAARRYAARPGLSHSGAAPA